MAKPRFRPQPWIALLPLVSLLACASASHAGEVTVAFGDASHFSDVRDANQRPMDVQAPLQATLQALGKRWLATDRSLDILITDVDLAGEIEPVGPRVEMIRVMRSHTSPRIALRYTLRDAQGTALRSAEIKLNDFTYLDSGAMATSTEPLRYEKQLLSQWFRREFQADGPQP